MSENSKSTALYAVHIALGAKMIDFGGWNMPVQYRSIMDEHLAVRNAVGVFDISHMGQVRVLGPDAATWLNRVLTNQVSALEIGDAQYSLMLNHEGGVIDDLIVYRLSAEAYYLVINAAKIEEDLDWLRGGSGVSTEGVEIINECDETAGLAVQGPAAAALHEKLFGAPMPDKNRLKLLTWNDIELLSLGTGYTGEDGFEIFFPETHAQATWEAILGTGDSLGIRPCGLGARDTLRLEMGYPLNGNDLSPTRTPLEAGLGFFVDLKKEEFIGKSALLTQKATGLPSRLAAFEMTGKTPPPRPHYPVLHDGAVIGEVASGGLSPSLGKGIGMVYLPTEISKPGTELEIDIRGKKFSAVTVKKPFFKKAL